MWVCVHARMTRERSAGSEMSKLLSFGYLDKSPQTAVENRKSSAATGYQPSAGPPNIYQPTSGTRYQPTSAAGQQATHQGNLTTAWNQPYSSAQSSSGAHTNSLADRQSAGGALLSSPASTGQTPSQYNAAAAAGQTTPANR